MEGYEAADGVSPGVFLDRFDCDEGDKDVFVGPGFLLEGADPVINLFRFGFGEDVVCLGVFDFADVQEAVGPVDDEVDLGTRV